MSLAITITNYGRFTLELSRHSLLLEIGRFAVYLGSSEGLVLPKYHWSFSKEGNGIQLCMGPLLLQAGMAPNGLSENLLNDPADALTGLSV